MAGVGAESTSAPYFWRIWNPPLLWWFQWCH